LAEKDVESMVKAAAGADCDVVEARLDFLADASDLAGLRGIRKPIVATCMPVWEGGMFKGMEEDRIRILESALEYAEYISIEYKTEKRYRDGLVVEAGKKGVKVIMAFHDFNNTPPTHEIVELMKKMEAECADIVKVAFKPRSYVDVLNVLKAQVSANLKAPVIAVSMGEMGRVSRVAGPMMGAFMTFAAPSDGKAAAAGQYTLDEVREIKRLLWR
jgi:3-dehydroquinate dehydratase I